MGYKGTKKEIYAYNRAAQIKYLSDPEKKAAHYARVKKRNERIMLENRQKLWDYYLSHPCVDCGENDPVVLESDHVRGIKIADVGNAVNGRHWSWNKVLEELAKCETRCANCHRRVTAQRAGWYKNII